MDFHDTDWPIYGYIPRKNTWNPQIIRHGEENVTERARKALKPPGMFSVKYRQKVPKPQQPSRLWIQVYAEKKKFFVYLIVDTSL